MSSLGTMSRFHSYFRGNLLLVTSIWRTKGDFGRDEICRVSYRDSEGIEHTVELEASSLYEAVGLAIERFRHCEHVLYEPNGLYEFVVEPRELTI